MNDLTRTCVGLCAAWAVHDAEELLTMSRNSADVLRRVPGWAPVPEDVRAHGVSQAHVGLSLAIMAALVGIASREGVRTAGRSAVFRGALLAFGAHGFAHIAGSGVMRGYTTGVVTAPTVVIPYWLCARHVLRRHGIRDNDAKATTVALMALPLLCGVHAVTRAILGERSLGAGHPAAASSLRLCG